MKRELLIFVFAIYLFPFTNGVWSEERFKSSPHDFPSIWAQVQTNSPSQKAKYFEWKAAESAKNRSEKHWLPRVYSDLRTFNTNDPALNFVSKLGQRSATDSDFSTASTRVRPSNFLDSNNQPYSTLNSDSLNLFSRDTLNNPGANTYSRGTLGVDLPIYEGGSGQAVNKMQEKRMAGLKWELEGVKQSEYSETAKLYRTLQSLYEFKEKLVFWEKKEARWQSGYQLTNRNNPVGYAGYLGLKSLKNKIDILSKEADSQIDMIHNSLVSLASELPAGFKPEYEDLESFSNRYLPLPKDTEGTYFSKAMMQYSEGEALKADVETAKFLPRVGLYTEANAYHGSRNLASAYNAGFYVQMNLYNPKDANTVEEAKLSSEAMRKKVEDIRKKEEVNLKSGLNAVKNLRETLVLLNETTKLMEEQIANTERLFLSGSVTAIQLAESLNRALDTTQALFETESQYIKLRSDLYSFQTGEIKNDIKN